MTIIRDVVDAKKESYSSFQDFLKDLGAPRRSITGWGKDAVLQFRVITSDSIDIDSASTISQGLEKHYAGLVEVIVNLNSVASDVQTPEEFVRKIHANQGDEFQMIKGIKNIIETTTMPDISSDIVREEVELEFKNRINPLTKITKSLTEEKRNYIRNVVEEKVSEIEDIIEVEGCDFLEVLSLTKESLDSETKALLVKSMDSNYEYYTHDNAIVRYESSSDMFNVIVPVKLGGSVVSFLTYPKMFSEMNSNLKSIAVKSDKEIMECNRRLSEDYMTGLNMAILNEKKINFKPTFDIDIKPVINSGGGGSKGGSGGSFSMNSDGDVSNIPASKVTDREMKKANELAPTMLELSVVFNDSDSKTATQVNFTVGVKCILHRVPSKDMITNLIDSAKNRGRVFQFLKWTTGEISLFKDLLFAVDSMKDDAINLARSERNRWWTTLKRLKGKRAMGRLTGDNILASSSLVVNMAEIDYIKNTENIDLMDPLKVRKIMTERMLLAFIIVEEDTETCHILFDSEVDFTQVTFSALKRMPKDTETRDLIKLMSRM